jgi:hypothetical protein
MFCNISQYPASRTGTVVNNNCYHDYLYFEHGTKVRKFLIRISLFYTRINKIKVFNNREGFLGLFNRAELQIYSHAAGYSVGGEPYVSPQTLADLIDRARRQKLLDAVLYALVDVSIDGLEDGTIIRLGDLGSIRVTLSSEGRATAEDVDATCIKKAGIIFVPGARIKKTLEDMKFVKTN